MSLSDDEAVEIMMKIFKNEIPTHRELKAFQFGYEIGKKNGTEEGRKDCEICCRDIGDL